MIKIKNRGQTTLEYSILIVIVLGALLGMQNYIKRGLQGRWKTSIDGLGDQYDPRVANTSIRHTVVSDTLTAITAFPLSSGGGITTIRSDVSNTVDSKIGTMAVGAY